MTATSFGHRSIEILGEDDRSYSYPRPEWPEVTSAWLDLQRRDAYEGGLPEDLAEPVKILLAAISRLSLDGLEQAFPRSLDLPCSGWDSCPNHDHGLRLVDTPDPQEATTDQRSGVASVCPACGSES